MRIVFIAPSVAPLIDGVADYVHRLAQELRKLGHLVLVIGLNDYHPGARTFIQAGAVNFSAATPWAERRAAVKKLLEDFGPDVISIQFYFRGFLSGWEGYRIAGFLSHLAGAAGRHIMHHESWEVAGSLSPHPQLVRHAGAAAFIACFHHLWRPNVPSFTNTRYFARQFSWLGFRARVAPVPSNIPVLRLEPGEAAAIWQKILPPAAGDLARQDVFAAVLFGRIAPDWPAEDVMPWLQRGLALSRRKRGLILSVGQTAYADAGWRRVKNAAEAAGFGTAKLGLQPADAVSAILQEADIGIVTTEADLLGKSSTYAAMLEHGLPVFSLDAAEVPWEGLADSAPDQAHEPLITPGLNFDRSMANLSRGYSQGRRWDVLAKAYLDAFAQ